jgi:CRISPR-associated protein Csm1
MAHAMRWLAEWSGHGAEALPAGLPGNSRKWLAAHRRLLGGSWAAPEPGAPLLSIFSRVRREGADDPPQVYWPAAALSVEVPAYPQGRVQARPDPQLWPAFRAEWEQIRGWEADLQFEAFTHLLHKYAWAVPCSYGEPGVSLYDEFRALSAVVHASGCGQEPAREFSLVGGDIPGIQRTIYTITSKGAAKGLRGRSAFIQLLGDAVIRRILQELDLPETNVIYAAGGNFMLLAQAGAAPQVDGLAQAINERLLAAFEGELALCLACEPLAAGEVGSEAFGDHAAALGSAIGQEKARRFAGLAEREWAKVFGPQGQGGVRFCAVCQHERQAGERGQDLEDGGWKCEQCAAFEELAQDIARERLLMFVSREPWTAGAKGWQRLLADLSGWWYDFHEELKPDTPPGTRVYSVNYLDFLGEYAHGFRLIANTTPREENGQVRTFEGLADGATGLKRVGVLRMDVDDLGQVLTHWLPERTMAGTSALSHALDRFFAGWLDAICREAMADPPMVGARAARNDLLYVIYAGGDDLFVVGAWDLMPLLADLIRQRFAAYVGNNPALHISAGISVEDRKFPLYQAAARAGAALDHGAKELTRQRNGREIRKDAVSFLGKAVGWETYPFVLHLAEQLTELTQEQRVPRSLLTNIRAIHDRYYEDVRGARERGLKDERVHYGPWMWRKVYQLSRTRQRYDREETRQIAEAIKELETRMLSHENMPYVGLATRWAEYLTRGGGTDGQRTL